MISAEIAQLRLVNQQLTKTKFTSAKEVVGWMCAMQAQDYAMAKWAIGTRLFKSTDLSIDQAINRGEIIRIHVMRPTWHFVLPEDVRWMLALTAPHIKASIKSSQKTMGLDDKLFSRTNTIIEKSLVKENHLTRAELMIELKKKKIIVDSIQAIHVMLDAELNGIACNGPMKDKQFTYALLDERVAATKSLKRDEALARLAKRYFTSHGPATVQDFMWWSGLPAADAKAAVESIQSEMESIKIENKIYWAYYFESTTVQKDRVYFLPSFDEFLISYKDRSASLDTKFTDTAITRNGIFKPVIVVNGKVIGVWSRAIVKDKVIIETNFFKASDKLKKKEMMTTLEPYGLFLNKKLEIK